MTQEEKILLLKDLCSRLPYKVKVYGNYSYSDGEKIVDDKRVEILDLSKLDWFLNGIEIKPYLRPLSSMTEEEAIELCAGVHDKVLRITEKNHTCILSIDQIDWLNSRHFDYRGLIPMGLALPATEWMYDIKTKQL